MKPISVAIETIDGKLDANALRIETEMTVGVRPVLNPEYADELVLVAPEPMAEWNGDILPPVRLSVLKAALKRLGVTVVTPSTLIGALEENDGTGAVCALKELRKLFREFKSNPLHDVEVRGKEPADPSKRDLRARAKEFKNRFYEDLARFIADHPGLSYKDYWDADRRPYEKQWPEYRKAVKRAKDIRGRE